MEYFLGSAITLAIVYFLNKAVVKSNATQEKTKILSPFTQSQKNEIVMSYMGFPPPELFKIKEETQSMKYFREQYTTKIVLTQDKAYWISDNALLVAGLIDGNIDKENAKVVDTMAMDKVELEKVIFIVEELTKGANNDNGNSGNKKLF